MLQQRAAGGRTEPRDHDLVAPTRDTEVLTALLDALRTSDPDVAPESHASAS